MSDPETGSQSPLEGADQAFSDLPKMSGSIPTRIDPPPISGKIQPATLPATDSSAAQPSLTSRHQLYSSEKGEAHHDLAHIIAHAREETRHLRQELTRLEANAARIAQERDAIEQKYKDLYSAFLEAVHIAVEKEVRQAAQELQAKPDRLPPLLEPVYDAITRWHNEQLAEREQALLQKLSAIELQAEHIRKELLQERQVLNTERDKLLQERQVLYTQIKAREAALRHRWFAKTWATSSLLFLILPLLQIYLLVEKASAWSIILIPTSICLALAGMIQFARARKKPRSQ